MEVCRKQVSASTAPRFGAGAMVTVAVIATQESLNQKTTTKENEMSTSENFEDLLTTALTIPLGDPNDPNCMWGAPIIFWGPPGIGKSERIEAVARALDLPASVLFLSTLAPESLSGVPMPDGKGGARDTCTLPQILDLMQKKRGLLFLDELSTVREAVQGPALGLVHARVVAGTMLPGGVRIAAAANPPEEAAGGRNLTLPMANRFMHIELESPTINAYCDWLLGLNQPKYEKAADAEKHIAEGWGLSWARNRGQLATFLKSNPKLQDKESMLHHVPARGDRARSRAWRSGRSWTFGIKAKTTADILKLPAIGLELLTGAVGEGPAGEYAEYIAKFDIPSPEDVLAGKWKPNKNRMDIAWSVYAGVCAYALDKKDQDERHEAVAAVWSVLEAGLAFQPDTVQPFAQVLLQKGFGSRSTPKIQAACSKVLYTLGISGLTEFAKKK